MLDASSAKVKQLELDVTELLVKRNAGVKQLEQTQNLLGESNARVKQLELDVTELQQALSHDQENHAPQMHKQLIAVEAELAASRYCLQLWLTCEHSQTLALSADVCLRDSNARLFQLTEAPGTIPQGQVPVLVLFSVFAFSDALIWSIPVTVMLAGNQLYSAG